MKAKRKPSPPGRGRLFWKVVRGGREIGKFHTLCTGGLRVNLWTVDAVEAAKRARIARSAAAAGFEVPDFRRAAEGAAAAADAVAALGNAAPSTALVPTTAGAPPSPPPAEPEIIEPEPIPQAQRSAEGWADDVAAAASASTGEPPPPEPGAGVRMADLPWLAGAIVTGSKVLVALQLRGQAWAIRAIGDVEAGRVGPVVEPAPQTEEDLASVMKKAAQPWAGDDPREPGRQVWEGFLKRVMPEDLPIPDYLLAPLLVGVFTLPVQIAGCTPIVRPAGEREAAATEARPDERAAA